MQIAHVRMVIFNKTPNIREGGYPIVGIGCCHLLSGAEFWLFTDRFPWKMVVAHRGYESGSHSQRAICAEESGSLLGRKLSLVYDMKLERERDGDRHVSRYYLKQLVGVLVG